VNIQAPQFDLPPSDEALALGTEPIPAGPYYREDYFELEREAIFKRVWLNIGHISEIAEPGRFMVRPLEVARTSLLITHGKDGKIRAFHNACTHRGTQLVEEGASGARSSFSCPYHGWTFNYDGRLRAAPDFERFYIEQAKCDLRAVAADVCAGLLFVNLDPHPAQSLREFLGPELVAQLETVHCARATTFSEYVYEIDANWKLTYDNFQENYHLRFIHPRSGQGAGGEANPFGYPAHYGFFGPHRTQRIWSHPDPASITRPIQGVAFMRMAGFAMADGLMPQPTNKEYFGLFPNFFMLASPMTPFSHTVYPISATRSRGVIRLYWTGEDENASERFAREFAMCSARDIHSEDRAVIEAGQKGLSSGALEHIHFMSQEVLCRHFFKQVDSRVQAYKAARDGAEARG
jgi:phenylpropionate dioxygenase-like ring-hydroxylating dioxygenase large terminal subunit